ncbi:MAG TPA: response regulator transcription factor [Gaiellaceae bacterium]|nr:response regulator transcription factor [Gaiellaceae bacterium]
MNTTGLGATSVSTGMRPYPGTAAARVLLVGEVRLFLELLERALADHAGLEVVGSAACDVAALAAGMYAPDIVVVDTASLANSDGIQALANALPDAKIVGVGVSDDEDLIVALLEGGASGYVTAEQPFADLVTAVEAAANGELPCPPRLSAALARRIAALAAEKKREQGSGTLTPRQREIASLIAAGLSNKQIARRLLIEQATVKNHVHTILVKLGVSRRDQVGRRLGAL